MNTLGSHLLERDGEGAGGGGGRIREVGLIRAAYVLTITI